MHVSLCGVLARTGLHFPLAGLMTRPLAVTGPHVCLALWSSGSNWATSCLPIFRVWNLMLGELHCQSECIKLRNTWIIKKRKVLPEGLPEFTFGHK
ncbi:hypothetical protein AVEN_65781-1 [Araneus ventricosus]|uniref:Uncharacterized protein n=1 Tax=Araneus ventricosus TaxID=182803 RepID=A0A4Y2ME10_ARAVE|nr:hypothetical protein AVEN_65781-1 [Araneus ventricosus]